MSSRTGNLSINSENIFPIVKKWLYSDHDSFFTESWYLMDAMLLPVKKAGADGRVFPS